MGPAVECLLSLRCACPETLFGIALCGAYIAAQHKMLKSRNDICRSK